MQYKKNFIKRYILQMSFHIKKRLKYKASEEGLRRYRVINIETVTIS